MKVIKDFIGMIFGIPDDKPISTIAVIIVSACLLLMALILACLR